MNDDLKLAEYDWWGNDNEPPEYLKTKKQLSELGLKPVKPVGFIEGRKYILYLYDPNNSDSVTPKRKASEKQLDSLKKGREIARYNREFKEWYRDIGKHLKRKNEVIKRCQEYLSQKDNFIILDTETTELHDAEIVQIAIINLDKYQILNTLVKPTISIPIEISQIHGITDNDVEDAPTFPEIYPVIKKIIQDKSILIYNSNFDKSILDYCCKLHQLPSLELKYKTECIMEAYAAFYGEWSNYYDDYKWHPLKGGNHTALGDCLATLKLIEKMANTEVLGSLKDYFRKQVYQDS